MKYKEWHEANKGNEERADNLKDDFCNYLNAIETRPQLSFLKEQAFEAHEIWDEDDLFLLYHLGLVIGEWLNEKPSVPSVDSGD